MRYVNCNYCGADDTEPVNSGPDLLLNRPGAYKLVRCRQCGLIYQNPQLTLDELPAHYPEAYQPYKKDIQTESLLRRLDLQHGLNRRCQQLVRRWPHQPGSLLDVGCATGLFLNQMRQKEWQVTGVELSSYAAEYARQTFGLHVITGTLEETALPTDSFDVVTLWDVLEHVVDPKETLLEIARVLKPGGMLLLGLPNPASFEARLFGASWVGWDRPRHLHLFTPTVLENYLHATGFKLDVIESLGGRLGLTLLSVEMMLNGKGVPAERYRPWLKFLYNRPFRLATWPIYRLGEWLNKATVMTVFARLAA